MSECLRKLSVVMLATGHMLLAECLFFSEQVLEAQVIAAPVLAKSPHNVAAGTAAQWDFTATDSTYKVNLDEFWIVDAAGPETPRILTFPAGDLSATPGVIPIELDEELADARVLGIAEIPHGGNAGLNLIVVDAAFELNVPPEPRIGLLGDDGKIIGGGFQSVPELDPGVRLSSISVHPTREEFVAHDADNNSLYVFDFLFRVIQGPVELLGTELLFVGRWVFGNQLVGSGAGVTYNGPDTVLVSEGFQSEVDAHLALEYDLLLGSYTGRVMDLSGAREIGNADLAFTSLASGSLGGTPALFAFNIADESIYAFEPLVQTMPEPVRNLDCNLDDDTQTYSLTWELSLTANVDQILIIENGVQVASLSPDDLSYQSESLIVGKTFVEVVTARNGVLSSARPICEFENTRQARLTGVGFLGAQLPNSSYGDLAVTKTPATVEDFRLYLYIRSPFISVRDHTLTQIDVYRLQSPQPVAVNTINVGLALAPLNGDPHLAVLDPDGFTNTGVPSAAFYPLAGDRETATQVWNVVDLNSIEVTPFLRSWDYFESAKEKYFVALGTANVDGVEVLFLVRLEFDGNSIRASSAAPVPQRSLSPFTDVPVVGHGISVLPSGNLLVSGADTFSPTFTEAYLTTPFTRGGSGPEYVGYAQGLVEPGQAFGFGPKLGPGSIPALATAFFESEGTAGIGVSYLVSGLTILLVNEPDDNSLLVGPQLLIQSENEVAHPELQANQLVNSELNLQSGQAVTTSTGRPTFSARTTTDYYVSLVNLSTTDPLEIDMEVLLDDRLIEEASRRLVLDTGRHHRLRLAQRTEESIATRLTNQGAAAGSVRVILGAVGVGTPSESPFVRGDCNANGRVEVGDAVFGLNALFAGDTQPGCEDACDFGDTGGWNIGDMVAVLNYLFEAAAPPAPPGPEACGVDPTQDDPLRGCVFDRCP